MKVSEEEIEGLRIDQTQDAANGISQGLRLWEFRRSRRRSVYVDATLCSLDLRMRNDHKYIQTVAAKSTLCTSLETWQRGICHQIRMKFGIPGKTLIGSSFARKPVVGSRNAGDRLLMAWIAAVTIDMHYLCPRMISMELIGRAPA